jgi:hypothetical protein
MQFTKLTQNSENLAAIMKQLNQEFKEMQSVVFQLKSVQKLVEELQMHQLIDLGIKYFIGSVGTHCST